MQRPTVAFIGLGLLGLPMARRLAREGFTLRVWNRTAAKAESVVALGATLADSPADAARGSDVVVTVVADDAVLREVTLGEDGFLGQMNPGGVHLSASTISPDTARELAGEHARRGEHYLATPVFGRGDAAEAGALRVCISGPAAGRDTARPVLDALGSERFDFGEEVGAANVVKLAGNFLIAGAIEAMAEAYTLAEKNGVPREQVHDLFSRTLFACPIYQNYGRMIARHEYEPAGFFLPLGLKDVRLFQETGFRSRVPTPLAGLVQDRMLAALAKGREEMDWTAFALEASESAGL
jgi:3-hydroxyisobutyrate dehydrogenase-like beta-hydroxyacid dehydrogenase